MSYNSNSELIVKDTYTDLNDETIVINRPLEEDMIIKLDQDKLAEICNTESNLKKWECSGDDNATIYKCAFGLVIDSLGHFTRFGDAVRYYELLLTDKDVFMHYDERFIIESVGSITITLKSLDDNNITFWFTKDEFKNLPIKYDGER